MKIRFKANSGVYGLPIGEDSATGEYPEGYEIEVDEIPTGWADKVDIVSGKPKKGAEFVTGEPENALSKDPGSEAAHLAETRERGTASKDEADQPRRGRPPVSKD